VGPWFRSNNRLDVSQSWPQPDRAVHKQFVETEGWTEVDSTHHDTYELELPNGDVLRTRISRPPSKKHTYGRSMWTHILRDQLDVTAAEFWACVSEGQVPDRGEDDAAPAKAIPVEVAQLLVHRVGLTAGQVKSLSRAEAIDRLNQYWATGD
jgi:hypothetical protein